MFITRANEFVIHPVLQNLAIYYPLGGLVGHMLAPKVDVGEGAGAGYIFKFEKSNIQGNLDDIRAYGTRASTFDWKLTKDSYNCEEHSKEKSIDWREFKKWARYLDVAKITQEVGLEVLLTNYEARVATLFTTTANYASSSYYTTLTGTDQWTDFVNSDPEGVIEDAREQVALNAVEPNAIAMPVQVWRRVRRHPAIRAMILEQNNNQLTEDGFPAKLFGLNAYYPGSRRVTSMPGVTETIARIWSDYVWVGVVNPRPTLRTMSFAYTLVEEGLKSEVYEDKPAKSDVVRIQHQVSDEKIVCNTAGYLIADVLG